MFISFEGIDGSGKTTLANKLCEELNKSGKKAIFTREPGGTEVAEKIRNLVMESELSSKEEILLYYAARINHIDNKIRPYLEKGYIVICDRFIDSTLVYQGKNQELIDLIEYLTKTTLGGTLPDLTFFIDVPVDVALERLNIRNDPSKYEMVSKADVSARRDYFLKITQDKSRKFAVIDSTQDIKVSVEKMIKIIKGI